MTRAAKQLLNECDSSRELRKLFCSLSLLLRFQHRSRVLNFGRHISIDGSGVRAGGAKAY